MAGAKMLTDTQITEAIIKAYEDSGSPAGADHRCREIPASPQRKLRVFSELAARGILRNTGPGIYRLDAVALKRYFPGRAAVEQINLPTEVIAALWTLHPLSERRPDAYSQALDDAAPFDATDGDYLRLYEEALSICRSNLRRFPAKTMAVLRIALAELHEINRAPIAMQRRTRASLAEVREKVRS